MKSFAIVLCIFFPLLATLRADTSFEDIYGIPTDSSHHALADQIVSARFDQIDQPLRQKYINLKNLQARLQIQIDQYPEDPQLWFLSGLNLNNLAETRYLIVLEQSGQDKAASDLEVSDHNIARSRAYDNAIRFDSDAPHLLSSTIYATMGYGLSNRQKIKTYSRELELGSPSENESNEWFMHWAKIDALVHEKKIEEAQAALAELKDLLQKRNRTDSPYSSIVTRAQKQVKAVVEKSEQRKASMTSKAVKLDEPAQAWTWKNWLLLSIGLLTFLSVLGTAIYIRRQ